MALHVGDLGLPAKVHRQTRAGVQVPQPNSPVVELEVVRYIFWDFIARDFFSLYGRVDGFPEAVHAGVSKRPWPSWGRGDMAMAMAAHPLADWAVQRRRMANCEWLRFSFFLRPARLVSSCCPSLFSTFRLLGSPNLLNPNQGPDNGRALSTFQ